MFSFKKWLRLQENVQGEYWIMGGSAMGADGNINDFTHEGYAIMHAASEIAEEVSDGYVDQQKYGWSDYGIDWGEFEQDLVAGFKKQHPEWKKEEDDEEILAAAYREMGVDAELVMIANGMGDTRNLAMKRWDWKAMRGNHVQTWNLRDEDVREISDGIGEIVWDQSDFEVSIEVMSTGKMYDVPLSILESGKASAVVNHGRNQGMTQHHTTAYNQAFAQQDKPSNPFYKRFGD